MPDKEFMRAWADYFITLGKGKSYKARYLEYIAKLADFGLPIIFETDHLASLLGRTPIFLKKVMCNSSKFYTKFEIPKRRGGWRTINAPYPSIYECQDWINNHILGAFLTHEAAHGFVRDRSILTNASAHLGRKSILKMDIADFFSSIKIDVIIHLFNSIGYAPNVSDCLARICCLNGALPQGAPTSPCLSNIISHRMDEELSLLANNAALTYTRYADDLTFSGEVISPLIIENVRTIAIKYKFSINDSKTLHIKNSSKKIVTGISVSGTKIRLPKKYKRTLRKEAFFFIKNYANGIVEKMFFSDISYPERLIGKLTFWKQVEPDNPFPVRCIYAINNLVSCDSEFERSIFQ